MVLIVFILMLVAYLLDVPWYPILFAGAVLQGLMAWALTRSTTVLFQGMAPLGIVVVLQGLIAPVLFQTWAESAPANSPPLSPEFFFYLAVINIVMSLAISTIRVVLAPNQGVKP